MIHLEVDERKLEKLYMDEVRKRLDRLDQELTYWDSKELKRQTNMSWNTIQDKFFHDPKFPKFSTGNKWYFPAKDCRKFLIEWARDHQYEDKIQVSS